MTPTGEKDLVHSDVLPEAGDGAVTQLLVERNTRFVSKIVEVEAHQIGIDPWPDAAWEAVTRNEIVLHYCGKPDGYIIVKTLEGEMRGNHGDWLIRGTRGEFYPCKPDVFAAKYQPVDRFRSQGGGIPEAMLVAAYKRGCQWCIENGVINNEDPTLTYIDKAAHDYADKVLAAAPPAAQSDADDYIDQLNVLCEDFGCEPGSDRLHWLLEQLSRLKELSASQPPASSWTTELRWVSCESCGGTGEVEVRPNVGPYSDPTPCAEICSACEGTGRFCEEVSPTERDADALTVPQGVISSAVEAEREACAKVADEYGREGT